MSVAFLAAVVSLLPAAAGRAAGTGADLVVVDLSADQAAVHAPYSYVYEIDNHGPIAASGVELTAALTGVSSVETVTVDRGACTYVRPSATVTCDIGRLASGTSATVRVVVKPSTKTSSSATVASASGEDFDASNNSAATSPAVAAAGSADLSVYPNSGIDDTGFGSMGYAIPGEPFDYSIDVLNGGPAIAEDVVLSVLLPFGVELQEADVPCTAHADDGANVLVSCPLGDIETARTVRLTAVAPLGAAGMTLRTEVAVDGSGPDPGPQPNVVSNYLVVAPGLIPADSSSSEGSRILEIPVQLYGSIDHTVTVDYSTADGSATAGEDYSAATGTLTFTPGHTSKSVPVLLLSDRATEAKESFTLTLSNVNQGAAAGPPVTLVSSQATATILDNDPRVSILDVRTREGDKGTHKAGFVIKLSHASPDVATVHFATVGGSARVGLDFKPVRKVVAFLPGQLRQVVGVPVMGDRIDERLERFFGKLTKPTGGLLRGTKAVAKILDDD